jgi:hypothetical protein
MPGESELTIGQQFPRTDHIAVVRQFLEPRPVSRFLMTSNSDSGIGTDAVVIVKSDLLSRNARRRLRKTVHGHPI